MSLGTLARSVFKFFFLFLMSVAAVSWEQSGTEQKHSVSEPWSLPLQQMHKAGNVPASLRTWCCSVLLSGAARSAFTLPISHGEMPCRGSESTSFSSAPAPGVSSQHGTRRGQDPEGTSRPSSYPAGPELPQARFSPTAEGTEFSPNEHKMQMGFYGHYLCFQITCVLIQL